jgi:hypothetical protein
MESKGLIGDWSSRREVQLTMTFLLVKLGYQWKPREEKCGLAESVREAGTGSWPRMKSKGQVRGKMGATLLGSNRGVAECVRSEDIRNMSLFHAMLEDRGMPLLRS